MKNQNVKLSIIVPVYNAEKYIHRCIDSILLQNFTNWELLLIDDGSSDQSGIICDAYSIKDSRIKVFHKENGGVSSARNLGLEHAWGEYVTFIDADDYIEYGYFDIIPSCVDDLVIMQCKHVYQSKITSFSESIPAQQISDFHKLKEFYSQYLIYQIIRVPWGKFFNRAKVIGLKFYQGQDIGEDTLFVLNFFEKCASIRINSSSYYFFQESDISDQCKYYLSVEKAISFLSRIFDAYYRLEIFSKNFEYTQFWYFKSLCQAEIEQNPALWHRNLTVKGIWIHVKKYTPLWTRLKYEFQSCDFLYRGYKSVLKITKFRIKGI